MSSSSGAEGASSRRRGRPDQHRRRPKGQSEYPTGGQRPLAITTKDERSRRRAGHGRGHAPQPRPARATRKPASAGAGRCRPGRRAARCQMNSRADAEPAPMPTRTLELVACLSCPAAERLEGCSRAEPPRTPTRRREGRLVAYPGRPCGGHPRVTSLDQVGQQAQEARALDGLGQLALLLGATPP